MNQTPPPLNDDEAYERLHAALLSLGREDGETARGDTALKAARRALGMLQIGLLAAMDRNEDKVAGVIDPDA